MTQTRYVPHLQELWEEADRLEDELQVLRARIRAGLGEPAAASQPIAPPWDVAPYSWAIAAQRVVTHGAIRTQATAMWRMVRERLRLRKLARANDATQRIWRDTSQAETELRLI